MYRKLYSSDYFALNECFNYYMSVFNKFNIDIKDKTVLELGPGNSLIIAYNLLLKGAQKVILVDKFPLNAFYETTDKTSGLLTEQAQPEYFKGERIFMEDIHGKDIISELIETIKKKNLIEFIASDLSDVKGLDNTVDLILSNSVFEHIYLPEKTIKRSAKILKKGAFALHRIDLRDHYNFSRPFIFYKYSEKVWQKYLTKLGVSYTNRIRYLQFKKMFESVGFKILYEEKKNEINNERRINQKFQNRNDLDIAQVDFLFQNKLT